MFVERQRNNVISLFTVRKLKNVKNFIRRGFLEIEKQSRITSGKLVAHENLKIVESMLVTINGLSCVPSKKKVSDNQNLYQF